MRVGIVGAGITGLALTHHLAERGVDCVTLEASDEPGGVIRSVRVDGVLTERGPQRVRLTPGIQTLVEATALTADLIEAPDLPLYVYADGALGEVPFDRSTFLETDLLSRRAKLRLLAEPLTSPGRPDETVAAVFRRKFGAEAYRNVFGPLYGGIYGSKPERMPARHALSGLLDREADLHSLLRAFVRRMSGGSTSPATFEDGLQALPRALADTHADRIRLETPATAVESADGPSGDYLIRTPDGPEAVDHVVVTTPAPVAADLLAGVAAGVDGLRSIRYNPLALVYLQSDFDRPGLGYQVGYGEDLHTLGVSWNASMFDRDGLYTVFLGGMHDPEVLDEPDDRLAEVATMEFETVTGSPARAIDIVRLDPGFPAWDDTWDALEQVETPEDVHLATNYTARMGIPSRVREAKQLAGRLSDED